MTNQPCVTHSLGTVAKKSQRSELEPGIQCYFRPFLCGPRNVHARWMLRSEQSRPESTGRQRHREGQDRPSSAFLDSATAKCCCFVADGNCEWRALSSSATMQELAARRVPAWHCECCCQLLAIAVNCSLAHVTHRIGSADTHAWLTCHRDARCCTSTNATTTTGGVVTIRTASLLT